ncbi:WD40 repeat domain-containing protein [Streptomyces sp. GTA36]
MSIETEQGFRFRGRHVALSRIVHWISEKPTRKVLVVTGSPGVGKSAVLGRIVTTADMEISTSLPRDDSAVRAELGSIACAVHAKGKTALDVAVEIAKAASAAIPEDIDYFPDNLRQALMARQGAPFNIIIDALDEATTGQEAPRFIIRRVLTPVAETCAHLGVRVIVGCRRRDPEGDLISEFGRAADLIDLDDPSNFLEADLEAYTLATLQLVGDERPENPYSDDAIAGPIARRIAAMADHNFLVAGLIARSHGLHDINATDPKDISFTPTVDGALNDYLSRIPAVGSCAAQSILTALAFAEAPGLSIPLWRIAIKAISDAHLSEEQLFSFVRSSAANFLVEASRNGSDSTYRLFHQALNDTLLTSRGKLYSRASDERSIALTLIQEGRDKSWSDADVYLRRSLAGHAEQGGVLDFLVSDDTYLLHADLRRLLPVIDRHKSVLARQRAKLIRRTRRAFLADPAERVALFSVTEAQQQLGRSYQDLNKRAPYRARWSEVVPGAEEAVLEGHTRWAYIVHSFAVADIPMVASAGGDRTVRIWDPILCEIIHVLEGHSDEVRAIASVEFDSRICLASAGRDGGVFIWDPVSGDLIKNLDGDSPGYSAMRSLRWNGVSLLVVASASEHEVSIIDPADGSILRTLQQHEDWISDICVITHRDQTFVASCSEDGSISLWDLAADRLHLRIEVDKNERYWREWIRSLCAVDINGTTLLAGACSDSSLIIWDALTGERVHILEGHEDSVYSVCCINSNDTVALASAGKDAAIRLWDPLSGDSLGTLMGHADWIYSLCPVEVGERQKLISTGDDRSIRLWDLESGSEIALAGDTEVDSFEVSCVLQGGKEEIAATASVGGNTVTLRNFATGKVAKKISTSAVQVMSAVSVEGATRLAIGGSSLEIWDPITSVRTRHWKLPDDQYLPYVSAICTIRVFDSVLMATAVAKKILFWSLSENTHVHEISFTDNVRDMRALSIQGRRFLSLLNYDGRIRIVDPRTGRETVRLAARNNPLVVQCVMPFQDRDALVTADENGLIELWDLHSGKLIVKMGGNASRPVNLWSVSHNGESVIVCVGSDRSLQVWSPRRATCLADIPVYFPITWAFQVTDTVIIGLSSGILGIQLESLDS